MVHKEESHKCKENIFEDAEIKHQKINVEQWSWVLQISRYATEFDLEDGIAERVGQIINIDSTLISYCPFCGVNLIELQKNTW